MTVNSAPFALVAWARLLMPSNRVLAILLVEPKRDAVQMPLDVTGGVDLWRQTAVGGPEPHRLKSKTAWSGVFYS